jgi:hypothetical protein
MSRKQQLRGTCAYRLGYDAFGDGAPYEEGSGSYYPGSNHDAWKLGWLDARDEQVERKAREPDDRMLYLLRAIRSWGDDWGDDGHVCAYAAIAEALEMIWEKVK